MRPSVLFPLTTAVFAITAAACKKTPPPAEPVATNFSAQDIVGKSWVPTGQGGYVELTFTDKTAKFELNFEGQAEGVDADAIVAAILDATPELA